MAVDKLSLYNNALQIIGERKLGSITENREPRRLLDSAFEFGAVNYCLEIVKPSFAKSTIKLTSSTTSSSHDLDNVFSLPDDWICTVGVYSDSRLDQSIERYINEGRTIACEYDTIYVRYVSSDTNESYTSWSPSFDHVVSTYLAREIATRLTPEEYEAINAEFSTRVEAALNIEQSKEPQRRPKASTTTLSDAWIKVYNDALLIMGGEKITNNNDDSHRRSVLDTALDASLVEMALEDIGWHWALKSVKSEYDPSIEPDWGYRYAHDKPSDMHRLEGVYSDEYFQVPLKYYMDEEGVFYAEETELYLQYVSSDYLTNPNLWSASFSRLIGAMLAKDSYMTLNPQSAQKVEAEFKKRESAAKSIDAMQSPPRRLAEGSWVKARTRGNPYNRSYS